MIYTQQYRHYQKQWYTRNHIVINKNNVWYTGNQIVIDKIHGVQVTI